MQCMLNKNLTRFESFSGMSKLSKRKKGSAVLLATGC